MLGSNFHGNASEKQGWRGCTEALSCGRVSDDDTQARTCLNRRVPMCGWGSPPKLSSPQQAAAAYLCQLQLQPWEMAPSGPGEHWWISGYFGPIDSFGLWCNGGSLCACFASLPCPAEIVNRDRAPQVQHRQAVSRKAKPSSASP